MALDEQARHHLYQRLEETLGADAASTLMEYMPPVGWADVATKRDLDQLGAATKHDIDQLAAATKHDIDQLAAATKHDIDQLAAATKHDIDQLGAATKHDIETLGAVLRTEIAGVRAEMHKETKTVVLAVMGFNAVTVLAAVLSVGALR